MLKIFSQAFGTKVLRRFFKFQPLKQGFSKFFKKMKPSETNVFRDFPKVGTFVPNDGSSTMVRPSLEYIVDI